MLSTQYRLRLEAICERIVSNEEVSLEDMIWANKLAKSNQSASSILRKARRQARNPEMKEGDFDDFMNQMDLGDPCLLYTSPSPRDATLSRMPSSA